MEAEAPSACTVSEHERGSDTSDYGTGVARCGEMR